MDILAFFIHPVELTRWHQILLLIPLCLSVSVVYKTTKCERVRDITLAALGSWLTVVVGMFGLGAALVLLYHWLA
jgi:Ca2+/Na+ antiporter